MAKPLKLTASKAHTVPRRKAQMPYLKEHAMQAGVFSWARGAVMKYPDLEFMYAIPNGFPLFGPRKFAVVNYMKAEGLKTGMVDFCLPCPRGNYAGMYVEMKTPDGVTSDDQDRCIEYLSVKYKVMICRSTKDAIDAIEAYLGEEICPG